MHPFTFHLKHNVEFMINFVHIFTFIVFFSYKCKFKIVVEFKKTFLNKFYKLYYLYSTLPNHFSNYKGGGDVCL